MSPRDHGFGFLTLLDDNPLVQHNLAVLRNEKTTTPAFAEAMAKLSYALAVEAARHVPTVHSTVTTPLAETQAARLTGGVVLVPILRAGLGLMEGFQRLFLGASVGHVGVARNHDTLEPEPYLEKLPSLAGQTVMVLDPMLATGGSAAYTIDRLKQAGARKAAAMVLVCVLAVPEGLRRIAEAHPGLPVISAALDPCLNDIGYIVPGLGDAGDRLYGTT